MNIRIPQQVGKTSRVKHFSPKTQLHVVGVTTLQATFRPILIIRLSYHSMYIPQSHVVVTTGTLGILCLFIIIINILWHTLYIVLQFLLTGTLLGNLERITATSSFRFTRNKNKAITSRSEGFNGLKSCDTARWAEKSRGM